MKYNTKIPLGIGNKTAKYVHEFWQMTWIAAKRFDISRSLLEGANPLTTAALTLMGAPPPPRESYGARNFAFYGKVYANFVPKVEMA